MSNDRQSRLDELGSHPEVRPPEHLPSPAPSLVLYVVLLMSALALLAAALSLGQEQERWSGFLSNLATEIIGAVIILLLVEQRVRSSEMRFIRGLPKTTWGVILGLVSGEAAEEVRAYAGIFSAQLDRSSPTFHLHRHGIEEELLARRSTGAVLVGRAGMGKTALMHELARVQAAEALKNPRKALVPVLVPARLWGDAEAADVLRQTMRKFYPLSDRTFERLLSGGRLLCLFDGIDEMRKPADAAERLKRFRALHPANGLFVSARPAGSDVLESLGLEKIVLPPLTDAEIRHVLELRRKASETGGSAARS